AGRDPIGPLGQRLEHSRADAHDLARHAGAGLSRAHAPLPRGDRGRELPEALGDLARGPAAHEMAPEAAFRPQPHLELRLALDVFTDAVALRTGTSSRKLALVGHAQQGPPVVGRV